MRITTQLLCDHVPIDAVARLIESYLLADEDDYEGITIGGHMEDIMANLSCPQKLDGMLAGACEDGSADLIGLVVNAGAKDFTRGLDSAVTSWNYGAAKLMIDLGAIVKHKTLEEAAIEGDVEMCRLLVKGGVSTKARSILAANGVLHNSAAITIKSRSILAANGALHNSVAMVELADLGTTQRFESLLSSAIFYESLDVIHHAIGKGASNFGDGLAMAAINGYTDLVKMMLDHGANPDRGLSGACQRGHRQIVTMLIEAGATVCACTRPLADHTAELSRKRKAEADETDRAEYEAYAKKSRDAAAAHAELRARHEAWKAL